MFHSHSCLPQKLWAGIVTSTDYILNRTGPTTVKAKCPYEIWYGNKSNIHYLKIVGCNFVHVLKEVRRKMDWNIEEGVMIGF